MFKYDCGEGFYYKGRVNQNNGATWWWLYSIKLLKVLTVDC